MNIYKNILFSLFALSAITTNNTYSMFDKELAFETVTFQEHAPPALGRHDEGETSSDSDTPTSPSPSSSIAITGTKKDTAPFLAESLSIIINRHKEHRPGEKLDSLILKTLGEESLNATPVFVEKKTVVVRPKKENSPATKRSRRKKAVAVPVNHSAHQQEKEITPTITTVRVSDELFYMEFEDKEENRGIIEEEKAIKRLIQLQDAYEAKVEARIKAKIKAREAKAEILQIALRSKGS